MASRSADRVVVVRAVAAQVVAQPLQELGIVVGSYGTGAATAQGAAETLTFTATPAGYYLLASLVPTQAAGGMWLGFRVVRPLNVPSPEEMSKYWNSGVGLILSGLGILDANDVCGHTVGDDFEWELKGESDIVGTVGGQRSDASECEKDPPTLPCTTSTAVKTAQ